jgi:peroxiredoxin
LFDSVAKSKATDSVRLVFKSQQQKCFQNAQDFALQKIRNAQSPAYLFFCIYLGYKSNIVEPQDAVNYVNEGVAKHKNHNQLLLLQNSLQLKIKANPELFLLNITAPKIVLPSNKNDSAFSLEALKGKYVLIDFWESSNKQYKQEASYLAATYGKFKDKNFTIFSVSIDTIKRNWKKAIIADSLNWHQVIDTTQWASNVLKSYYIQQLPYNVLINPSGKIIAFNLRQQALRDKLKELIKE